MKMLGRRRSTLFLAALSMLVVAPRASRAEDGERSAQQHFDRGMKMRDEGKCQVIPVGDAAKCRESIDGFRHAYALNPNGLGALRNLAYVERSMGMVTSAARHFHELARKAPLDSKPERQRWAKFAEEAAVALEPRAPHLVVKIPGDRPADLKVYLDEELLSEAIWGVSLDVDPGAHAIRAESAKVPTFAVSIDLVERETRTIDVIFPVSTTAPIAPPLVPMVAVSSAATNDAPVTHVTPYATKANLAPILVGTAGGALLIGALVTRLAAGDEHDSACMVPAGAPCDPSGLSVAQTLTTMSTVLAIAGGATLVTGITWFIIYPSVAVRAPKKTQASLTPYFSTRGGGFAGTF